jgi:hypothetical protein
VRGSPDIDGRRIRPLAPTDGRSENNPAAVSVDQFTSVPDPGDAVAMTNTGDNCGGHMDFFVGTQRHPEVTVNQGGSQNNATVSGPGEESNTVGFTIVIP